MTRPTKKRRAARPRKTLTQIAPVSWEHPADRAALQSLRSMVVNQVVGTAKRAAQAFTGAFKKR